VIPVATRDLSKAGGCGCCAVVKDRPRGRRLRTQAGTRAGWRAYPCPLYKRAREAVSQNSTACTGSSSAGCGHGRARFGRHARPHGRGSVRSVRPRPRGRRTARTAPCRAGTSLVLPRKEVIQPHLPVRLPCYDFTPVTSPTFDGSLPQGVRPPASGVAHSRGVTGGVYKARERIHRGNADPRLLATPPSCRRVSACNPNRDAL
jgi:hypothetical protein